MEKWKKRAVELMTLLALGGRNDPSVVPFNPQKNRISMPEEAFFSRSTPEKQGISSRRIYNMLCELEGESHANIHSLMVIRGGEVISECSADGYDVGCWHISQSMAKTVCGMVIGRLIDEGKLRIDDRLVDIFPDVEYRDKKFASITIEHLLTMTSGVEFAEAGVVTDNEWTKTFFASVVRFVPGTKFSYNSMNTYILARAAERVCKEGFGRIVESRIFAPMGIKNYLWEMSAEGTEKAGWGLYMSAESWAKLGIMMLSGGEFFGSRILSEKWVRSAVEVKALSDDFNGNFNYGYHLWTTEGGGEFLFNGMLGQNVWVCPRNDMVVVMLGGNNELFQASPALEIVRKYLGGRIEDQIDRRDIPILRRKEARFFSCRRWVRPKDKERGIVYLLKIKPRGSFDKAWGELLGRYVFANNNLGMLPLIVRVMQNNLRCSLEEMIFRREGEELYLDYREHGESYTVRIGLYGYTENVLQVNGEIYIVKAMGEARRCPDGETEYRIELIFCETASRRRICIRKRTDFIKVSFSESPSDRVVENAIHHYAVPGSAIAFAVDVVERRLGEGAVREMIRRAFNQTLVGADASKVGYMDIVNNENRQLAEEMQKMWLIRSLVDRFFKDDTRERDTGQQSADNVVKKSISNIIDMISGKPRQNTNNDNLS